MTDTPVAGQRKAGRCQPAVAAAPNGDAPVITE
jgi:hypothetical protein